MRGFWGNLVDAGVGVGRLFWFFVRFAVKGFAGGVIGADLWSMKYSLFLLVFLISFGLRAQRLTTVAPLLGGVNVSYIVSPVKAGDGSFMTNQVIVDESSPVYKDLKAKHPVLIKVGARYHGLYLSGEDRMGGASFHAISVPVIVSYGFSRNTNITAIASAGVASDFRKDISGSDIFYNAGVRLGWGQATNFKFGVTVIYSKAYTGSTLIPLPDIDWTISKRWRLEALLPFRTSLKYKLNESQTLALTQGFTTVAYRLNDGTGVGKYLQLQQVSGGLMYEHVFSRRWSVHLIGGYGFSSKLETFNNTQTVGFNDFGAMSKRIRDISYDKGAVIGQVGISYKF